MAVALPDVPWSVDDSSVEPAPGRIIDDLAVNGTTGDMLVRGQILVFNLVWPVLDQAEYLLFLPFETTNIQEDVTVPYRQLTYTCRIVSPEPFFEHVKGVHYRGRMTLRQKDVNSVV